MTSPAWFFLTLAAIAALTDWIAVSRGQKRIEYLAKPATLIALIVVAVALEPFDEARRAWFAAALLLSLVGDVFLMLPSDSVGVFVPSGVRTLGKNRDLFVPGLASFLLAHIAYIVGFEVAGGSGQAFLVALAGVTVAAVAAGTRVVPAVVRRSRSLVPPVLAYIAAISVMVAEAYADGRLVAALGATLFFSSDLMIAWSRFVHPFRGHRTAIMVTYHLAQGALVLSLLD